MTPISVLLLILFFELSATIFGSVFGSYPFFGLSYILFVLASSTSLIKYHKMFGKYLLFFGLFLGASVFLGSTSLVPALSSLRVFLFFPMLLFFPTSRPFEGKVYVFVIISIIIFSRYFVGNLESIKFFDLWKAYEARGISSDSGVPFGFVTNFGSKDVVRTWVGFFAADKGAYAAAAALSVLSALWYRSKSYSKVVYGLIFLYFSLVLFFEVTLVKAALLGLLCIVVLVLLVRLGVGIKMAVIGVSLASIISVLTVLMLVPQTVLSSSGAISHIAGLVQPILGIDTVSEFIFGNGAGKGGTLSMLAGGTSADGVDLSKSDIGGESTIGALIYQIGFGGLALCIFLICYCLKDRFVGRLDNQIFAFSLFIVSFFSEAVTSIVAMLTLKICADCLVELINKHMPSPKTI